jgi:hypothetical protein
MARSAVILKLTRAASATVTAAYAGSIVDAASSASTTFTIPAVVSRPVRR